MDAKIDAEGWQETGRETQVRTKAFACTASAGLLLRSLRVAIGEQLLAAPGFDACSDSLETLNVTKIGFGYCMPNSIRGHLRERSALTTNTGSRRA